MSGILQEGTLFASRYPIIRRIASGGMVAVYEETHLETDRRRNLKVMHTHILQSAKLHQRSRLAVKVAAQIESDFIVAGAWEREPYAETRVKGEGQR